MKKKINKKEWSFSRIKKLKECCDTIFHAFENPGGYDCLPYMTVGEFIESITPWEKLLDKDWEEFGTFFYAATRVSFALGYTCGQMLDAHDAETGLIEKAMREKKALLYLPHKKKAA